MDVRCEAEALGSVFDLTGEEAGRRYTGAAAQRSRHLHGRPDAAESRRNAALCNG
jgi:hypothetical protein